MISSSPWSSRRGQGAPPPAAAAAATTAAKNIRSLCRAHRRRRSRASSAAAAVVSVVVLFSSCSLSLASAQGTQDHSLVDSIGAATLAGQAANAAQSADQAAAAVNGSGNGSGTPSSAKTLTDAEKQAKIDRVLSFLSAGNIFVGNYQPYNRVVRRRVKEFVECRYNGTLTSRGVGVEESLPDVARLAFAYVGTKEEVSDPGIAAYARINAVLSNVGFVGFSAALNSASSDVSLSPIKFVLPQGEDENDNNDNDKNGDRDGNGGGADNNTPNPQYLVEVRVVLQSQDAPHLELGASTALEAAVASAEFAASSAVFELSLFRLSQMFNAARIKANEDMLYALISDAAQLGVLLGPLDEYAPERRQQVTSAPDADAFDTLAAAGGGRPSRLFAVVEVAASYQVCSGGLESKREFVKIDEDGFDITDSTMDPTGP